ncbi:hypothetical protein GOV07_02930 [Candidatus Woesearchaeota archaeon]|nr:hypothetical protein [Candidatus Woesearchaeota archaeon]
MKRKGDIFALQEFYLGMLLLILCILLFGLYWLAAQQFKDKFDSPDQLAEDLAASGAGSALRTYLSQQLDWPGDALSNGTVASGSGSMAEGWGTAFTDAECVAWLEGGTGAFPTVCKAVQQRTTLFFSTLCSDYLFEVRLGDAVWTDGDGVANRLTAKGRRTRTDYELVHGSTDAFSGPLTPEMLDDTDARIRKGAQTVPTTQGVVATRLVCIDREVQS